MEYKFKVIVLGDFSSGKTSIVKRIKDDTFYNTYTSTIGVDYLKKRFDHEDIFNDTLTLEDENACYEISKQDRLEYFKPKDTRFKKYHACLDKAKRRDISYSLSLWDTSGQEKFSNITLAYYRNISACIFVFDLTNFNSFKSIETWHSDLFSKINQETLDNKEFFPKIIVGNKTDLDKSRVVTKKECIELASKLDCKYIECSAKDNDNIKEIFAELIKSILFCINHELLVPSPNNGINIIHNGAELFPVHEFSIDEPNRDNKCCTIM